MTEIALLSPNGQQETAGAGPATRLIVATVKGLVRIERRAGSQLWDIAGEALREQHASSLLLAREAGALFAGTHCGGVWCSDDGSGATWRQVSHGIAQTNIYSLACRQQGKDIVLFAGAEPAAIYRSDDFGESWRELPALRGVPGTDKWHFPPPPHIAHVKSITLHPARPTTLFACVEQGALLTSEDDGETWRELDDYSRPDDPTYRDTHRIALHPTRPEIAYLTTGVGLYRSDDGGCTWRALTRRGSRLGYPDFILLDPENPDSLYIAGAERSPKEWAADGTANSAVLKSEDGGRTWRELRAGLPERIEGGIEAMSRHSWPGGAMMSFATAKGEIYASENGGERWTLIAKDLPPVSKSVHYRAFLPGARERGRAAYG
ncbi:MAG: WD40/YVTN/BNR-like repeat-containing protein [Stellaceae bacterium]